MNEAWGIGPRSGIIMEVYLWCGRYADNKSKAENFDKRADNHSEYGTSDLCALLFFQKHERACG